MPGSALEIMECKKTLLVRGMSSAGVELNESVGTEPWYDTRSSLE